jgi:hypothetical protein
MINAPRLAQFRAYKPVTLQVPSDRTIGLRSRLSRFRTLQTLLASCSRFFSGRSMGRFVISTHR